jgi:CDP-paratose 2-epimerase
VTALPTDTGPILVTGGSGFIGSNLADSFLQDGHEVIVLDNLSRPGVEQNLDWLVSRHGNVHPSRRPARRGALREGVATPRVIHLAAQTAVTTSSPTPGRLRGQRPRHSRPPRAVRATARASPSSSPPPTRSMAASRTSRWPRPSDRYIPADDRVRDRASARIAR